MDGAPESIEVVNELAQSMDGSARIETGTQTAPVNETPTTTTEKAEQKGTPCIGCGKIHKPAMGWTILKRSPDGKTVSEKPLPPPGSDTADILASTFEQFEHAPNEERARSSEYAEVASSVSRQVQNGDLSAHLKSVARSMFPHRFPQALGRSEQTNAKPQADAKPEADTKAKADASKPQVDTKSGESARLLGDIRAEMARGSMSARFKSVSVAKSGDRTFEILNAFAAVIRYTESEEGKRALSVPDLNDIRLLFDHAKRIVKTRDSDELLETLRSANHTGVAKRASKSIQRIFKYAMAAIRLLAGQASIEFLRAK